MSMFKEWVKKRRLKEEFGDVNPSSKFQFDDSNEDIADDYEHVQKELFEVVLRKYPEETTNFFQTIAQRGDEEVSTLLNKLGKNTPASGFKPHHPDDKDEVMPYSADTGYSDYGNE